MSGVSHALVGRIPDDTAKLLPSDAAHSRHRAGRNARIVQLCEWAEDLLEDRTSALGEAKILNGQYGTRCSTVLLRSENHISYAERVFGPDGAEGETRRYRVSI